MHLADCSQQTGFAIHPERGQKVLHHTVQQDSFAAVEYVLQSGGQFRKLRTLVLDFEGMILVASTPLLAEIPLAPLYMQISSHVLAHHVTRLVSKGAGKQWRQIPQRILIIRQSQLVKVNYKKKENIPMELIE